MNLKLVSSIDHQGRGVLGKLAVEGVMAAETGVDKDQLILVDGVGLPLLLI